MYTALFADGMSFESSLERPTTQDAIEQLESLGVDFEVQSVEELGLDYAPGAVLVFDTREGAQTAADDVDLIVVDQTKDRDEDGRRL